MEQDSNTAFSRWHKKPSPAGMHSILSATAPDIDRAIRSAGGQVSPLTRGLGRRIVAEAAKSYRADSGTQFRSWAQTQLQRLVRDVRGTKFTTKVPEVRAREAMRVKDIVAQLEADTGFEPADSDIADRLGISLKKVRQLRAGSVPEIINQGDNDVEEELTNEGLLQDMVYADLDSRGKVIMEHLTGYNGAPVLPAKEIAKKLKISPAAVSQRLNTVRQLLAEAGVALSA